MFILLLFFLQESRRCITRPRGESVVEFYVIMVQVFFTNNFVHRNNHLASHIYGPSSLVQRIPFQHGELDEFDLEVMNSNITILAKWGCRNIIAPRKFSVSPNVREILVSDKAASCIFS